MNSCTLQALFHCSHSWNGSTQPSCLCRFIVQLKLSADVSGADQEEINSLLWVSSCDLSRLSSLVRPVASGRDDLHEQAAVLNASALSDTKTKLCVLVKIRYCAIRKVSMLGFWTAVKCGHSRQSVSLTGRHWLSHRCKNRFLRFLFLSRFYVFNVFLFSVRF